MLPLGGLFIAIFAAWVMKESSSRAELHTFDTVFKVWRFLVRYITPVAVIIVFLWELEIISL